MLGEEKYKALLGFHCFTGCDQTAKFYGKSKLSCWKTFLNSPSQVITAFNELGDGAIVSTSVRNGLTLYLLDLYNKSRPRHISDISKLRWYLYSKNQVESEQLPPTSAALEFKIKRSHYLTKVWKAANLASPILPEPGDFGWRLEDDAYHATMTDQPSAPDAIIELSFCRCKTNCTSMRCKCRKNDLLCTEMCYCDGEICENREDDTDPSLTDEDESDYDEFDC